MKIRVDEMLGTLRNVVNKSPKLTHLNYLKGQLAYRLGLTAHKSGATHNRLDLDESVGYVRNAVQDYLRYSGCDDESLVGKRILEIGPGDNLGVGLLFLAYGADSYTAIDRFSPLSNASDNQAVYGRLFQEMSLTEQSRLNGVVETLGPESATISKNQGRLTAHYNCSIEGLNDRTPSAEFDIIISRAVLEHVFNLDKSWENMVALLAENGEMWHKVDFRNHGFYHQFHPLFFLTASPLLWRFVSQPDPTLNRHRTDKYRSLAEEYFRNSRIFYTHILGQPELIPHRETIEFGRDYKQSDLDLVAEIRPSLAPEFTALTDEELLVNGIFQICKERRGQR